ncbi:NPC intracellular cholesterol transporter 2-like isoform X2 [Littorina saxatilis]|uniref:NPC intracellular cholesterol transporter 2-like isoform X2 n=1 Tax=Littorina saxatilis TaxID=31220 RepID=UPI0038B4AC96
MQIDSKGQLVRVDVMPCDAENRDPACKLPRDGFVTLTLIFTSPTEIRAAKPSAYVNLNGTKVSVPFTMEKDSCQRFETSCPLAPNVEHTYTTSVFVSGTYGKLRTVAEWQIHDQNDQKVTCLTLPVELV